MPDRYIAYYINTDGKPVYLPVDERQMQALDSGQDVCLESPGAQQVCVTLRRQGEAAPWGVPCARVSPQGPCPRSLLQQTLERFKGEFPFERLEVICDLYIFDRQNFTETIAEHAACLTPRSLRDIDKAAVPLEGVEVSFAFSPEPCQYELHLAGADPLRVLDAIAPAQQMVYEFSRQRGLRPFFAPKIDNFAPSGRVVRLCGVQGLEPARMKAAGLGLYDYAREMTLASCCQVNSYKRITPKQVIAGQRIPCYLRAALGDDRNAIARFGGDCITFYLADNYSNIYLSLAGNLAMLLHGLNAYRHSPNEERWQSFLASTQRMPSSLVIACDGWERCDFAKSFYGEHLHASLLKAAMDDWEAYCDIAHPWELLKGVEYERR